MRRIIFVSLALVVGACSSSAEPLPGDFAGSGADGFSISFTVTDDLTIPKFEVMVSCGPITRMESVSVEPVLDASDGTFGIDLPSWGFDGSFGGDGSEVSGSWHSGDCSGSWDGSSG